MKSRKLAMTLAVVAMMLAAMAPASAGGVNSADLASKGWDCALDNFPAGAGVHCAKTSLGDFISGEKGTLHLMVFSSPDDARYPEETFLGTEILRFTKDGELIARHAWHGGFNPTEH